MAKIWKPRIFISYARADENAVLGIYDRLTKSGFSPWMDKRDIAGGERWDESIERAIRSADFVLVCLSPRSLSKRGYLQKELCMALDLLQHQLETDIYLIPVKLRSCELPERLSKIQCVNLSESDGWARLFQALRTGMNRREEALSGSLDGAFSGTDVKETEELGAFSLVGMAPKMVSRHSFQQIANIAYRAMDRYRESVQHRGRYDMEVGPRGLALWATDFAMKTSGIEVIRITDVGTPAHAGWLFLHPRPTIVTNLCVIREWSELCGVSLDVASARLILQSLGHYQLSSHLLRSGGQKAMFTPSSFADEDARAWLFAGMVLSLLMAGNSYVRRCVRAPDNTPFLPM